MKNVLIVMVLASTIGLASAEIPEEVIIGGIFDKNWSGGDEGSRVAEIAVDDFNEYLSMLGANWTLSMQVEDAQSISPLALEKIQAFKSIGVDMLVGMAYSSHLSLAAGYIESQEILVISHASQAANLAIDDSVFRLVPNDGNQAPPIIDMLEDAGIQVLVTVVRGDTWGDGLADNVQELFAGTIVSGSRYNPDISEFSLEASFLEDVIKEQIDEHGADVVGVLYVGNDEFLPFIQSMMFYENTHNVRWFGTNTQLYKTFFFEDPAAIQFVKNTQFTATRYIPQVDNSIKQHIDAVYMDMYNATISTYGYSAYDSVWLLGTSILQVQSVDTSILIEAIPQVASHMIGASGSLELTKYGDLATADFEVWQISDGAWVPLEDIPLVPEYFKHDAEQWILDESEDKILNDLLILHGDGIVPAGHTGEPHMPRWLVPLVQWYVDGTISDAEFLESISYMIELGIIVIVPP